METDGNFWWKEKEYLLPMFWRGLAFEGEANAFDSAEETIDRIDFLSVPLVIYAHQTIAPEKFAFVSSRGVADYYRLLASLFTQDAVNELARLLLPDLEDDERGENFYAADFFRYFGLCKRESLLLSRRLLAGKNATSEELARSLILITRAGHEAFSAFWFAVCGKGVFMPEETSTAMLRALVPDPP